MGAAERWSPAAGSRRSLAATAKVDRMTLVTSNTWTWLILVCTWSIRSNGNKLFENAVPSPLSRVALPPTAHHFKAKSLFVNAALDLPSAPTRSDGEWLPTVTVCQAVVLPNFQ
jgi:hypothetical protein